MAGGFGVEPPERKSRFAERAENPSGRQSTIRSRYRDDWRRIVHRCCREPGAINRRVRSVGVSAGARHGDMDNGDDDEHKPGTSRGELSDAKPLGCPVESPRLNNNVVNSYDASKCCADCNTAAQQDHMIAASLVHCDQEDNGSDIDDDFCIYTYRGDRQEPAVAVDNVLADDRNASPLMDYLEMDFEPEPTASGESVLTTSHESEDLPERIDNEPMFVAEEPEESRNVHQIKIGKLCKLKNGSTSSCGDTFVEQKVQPAGTSLDVMTVTNPDLPPKIPTPRCNGVKEDRNGCLRRNADTMEVCHKLKRMRVDDVCWIKEMVWSESNARKLQINQLGKSACGATSVVNTLLALRIPFDIDHIKHIINTRLRDENAPLIPYLESRAVAGCMPQDLVRTLESVTDVTARFFATDQNLDLPIAPWLANWIKKGAVPILTLNRQREPLVHDSPVPDSWHHQMLYGVSYNPLRPECGHVYLTNPLSKVCLEALRPQLFSPSILMIRREDVLSRWTPQTDLMSLVTHPSQQWHEINVLGQVVNLLREANENIQFTEHIVIPASYQSGIILAMKTGTRHCHELITVPEL